MLTVIDPHTTVTLRLVTVAALAFPAGTLAAVSAISCPQDVKLRARTPRTGPSIMAEVSLLVSTRSPESSSWKHPTPTMLAALSCRARRLDSGNIPRFGARLFPTSAYTRTRLLRINKSTFGTSKGHGPLYLGTWNLGRSRPPTRNELLHRHQHGGFLG